MKIQIKAKSKKKKAGFTLLELIVAIGIFSIVMMIAVGALLSMLNANRKAQALKSVMNNVNFAMENMVKEIRVGTTYRCAGSFSTLIANIDNPIDCTGGANFAFEKSDGDTDNPNDQASFRLIDGSIHVSNDGGATYASITSPDVTIEQLRFWVYGSNPDDQEQPRAVIVVKGSVIVADGRQEEFNVQTTVTQRLID